MEELKEFYDEVLARFAKQSGPYFCMSSTLMVKDGRTAEVATVSGITLFLNYMSENGYQLVTSHKESCITIYVFRSYPKLNWSEVPILEDVDSTIKCVGDVNDVSD